MTAPIAHEPSDAQSGRMQATKEATAQSSGWMTLDHEQIAAFGQAIDALRREFEPKLGARDAEHIRRIGKVSARLELLGRSLIHICFEPLGFGLGTAALWAHKTLELMEIGHMALHGAYDGLAGASRFQSESFRWKAPIDEASWKIGHNVRHHQYTNIAGKDPDLDFGALRLSARIPFKAVHKLQPLSNWITWFGFTTAINLHVTGILDIYLRQGTSEVLQSPSVQATRDAQRTFAAKWTRYYCKEYVLFPMLAGPFFAKVLLANVLSDVGRDLFAAAIIYCGHVGASDYPTHTQPASRAHWYAMQVEAARDVELPEWLSILCGALDLQIEHHLFPRMPPNRLRELAPRVRQLCAAHGVRYRSGGWLSTLRSVVAALTQLRSATAT